MQSNNPGCIEPCWNNDTTAAAQGAQKYREKTEETSGLSHPTLLRSDRNS